jgi:hypothetical protein
MIPARGLAGAAVAACVWVIALLLGGCATTPEGRLRNKMVTEIYWDAENECEVHFHSLHRNHIALNGDLELDVDAGQISLDVHLHLRAQPVGWMLKSASLIRGENGS